MSLPQQSISNNTASILAYLKIFIQLESFWKFVLNSHVYIQERKIKQKS